MQVVNKAVRAFCNGPPCAVVHFQVLQTRLQKARAPTATFSPQHTHTNATVKRPDLFMAINIPLEEEVEGGQGDTFPHLLPLRFPAFSSVSPSLPPPTQSVSRRSFCLFSPRLPPFHFPSRRFFRFPRLVFLLLVCAGYCCVCVVGAR